MSLLGNAADGADLPAQLLHPGWEDGGLRGERYMYIYIYI